MAEELDIFQDTTAEETFEDTTTTEADESSEGRMYDYTNQREDGGSQNLYWGNINRQVTEEELRELYEASDNARLRESFGTFDNYLAYMNERQDLIDSGEYKADWWDTGVALVSEETLADREAGMDDKGFERSVIEEGARLGEEGYNSQKDVFQDLYEKYTGESTTKYLDNGARYDWNGTSFVLTQEAYGFSFGSFFNNVLPLVVISAGMPAGAFGGGFFGGAAKGALGSAIGQGITNGKISPDQLLQSAVLGGIGGFFDDLVAAEPGVYGGWIVDGEVVGPIGEWSIEKIQFLSDKLGIPFDEAAGIVEGILTGTVTGEDLEGIAINAVGGWTDAKVSEFIQDTFGDAGLDVENFFREGTTNISTEAIQGLASNGIQALIDGGMSDTDAVGVFYDFFVEGGSLDFLWPALPEFSGDFDFCGKFPLLCEAGLPEICKKDNAGKKPWYCDIDFKVDVSCPEWMKDAEGNCIDLNCPEWAKDEDGNCLDILPNVELCSEEELTQGGQTIRIGNPDTWFCKLPDVNVEVCTEEELAKGGYTVRIGTKGEGICKLPDAPDIELCTEEQKQLGGKTVYIGTKGQGFCEVPNVDIELCSDEELAQGGETIRIGNKDSWYCNVPDVDVELCSDEQVAQGGFTVKIGNKDSWYCNLDKPCPIGQKRNPETGKCEKIEGPEKPEGPDIDGPDIDLPSLSIGANPFEGAFEQSEVTGLSYAAPQVPGMLAPPAQKDYTAELNNELDALIQRNLGGMFKGMG